MDQFELVDHDEPRPLEKFYFKNIKTGKYYIVGAYNEEHAFELLTNIDENLKFTLESVAEEEIPET